MGDVDATVGDLRAQGVPLRNEIANGIGGRQILVQDLSGNFVELFEPVLAQARLTDRA